MAPTEDHDTVEQVERWLLRSIEALLSSFDDRDGNFWRASAKAASDSSADPKGRQPAFGAGKGATSNNRSFQSLVSMAYYFHAKEVEDTRGLTSRVKEIVGRMTTGYLTAPLEKLRSHGENHYNPMTDAQLLLSLGLALSPVTEITSELALTTRQRNTLTARLTDLAMIVANQIDETGVRLHESPTARPHHFLTMHSVRALDIAHRTLGEVKGRLRPIDLDARVFPRDRRDTRSGLEAAVRDETVRQLGLHLLPAPGFDSASLVSSCALLGRFTGDADSPLVQQAVDALRIDQSDRGSWTSAGVLTFGRRRMVYIPSIELSLALANLALRDLYDGDSDIFRRARPALEASFRLVRSAFSRHGSVHGWRNDRAQSGYEIESWTTAVVAQFLMAYREVLTLAKQEAILHAYHAEHQPIRFSKTWVDLNWLVPSMERRDVLTSGTVNRSRLAPFLRQIDPTETNEVVQGVVAKILEPTMLDIKERPADTASFLLFGPPGTRKTSLVREIAKTMQWPLVTLSPPMFLKNGIEGFEAAANDIFEDLLVLRRVVVLFDECEEFFRWRPDPKNLESRTVGAFMTSGMLPRLQRLRDRSWIVFVINTNIEAFELDDAVTRRGRLDRAVRYGHPVLGAQLRYLRAWRHRPTQGKLGADHVRWFKEHLTAVEREMLPLRDELDLARKATQMRHPDRGDVYRDRMRRIHEDSARLLTKVVTFAMLDALAERCIGEGGSKPIRSSADLGRNLQQEFERFGPDSFGTSRPGAPSNVESVTVAEAVRLLELPRSVVQQWIDAGVLRGRPAGARPGVDRSSLEGVLERVMEIRAMELDDLVLDTMRIERAKRGSGPR